MLNLIWRNPPCIIITIEASFSLSVPLSHSQGISLHQETIENLSWKFQVLQRILLDILERQHTHIHTQQYMQALCGQQRCHCNARFKHDMLCIKGFPYLSSPPLNPTTYPRIQFIMTKKTVAFVNMSTCLVHFTMFAPNR